MTFRTTDEEPSVTYEFRLPEDAPPLVQIQGTRRIRIKPQVLTVTASNWREPGVLHVAIQGRTINDRGNLGQHRRIAVYRDDASLSDSDAHARMAKLPEWAAKYVDRVRPWEEARR